MVITSTIGLDDGRGGTASVPVVVTLQGANDAPAANPDFAVIGPGKTLVVPAPQGVLAYAADPDIHDVQRIASVSGLASNVGQPTAGTFGTLTLNADGSYSYVAKAKAPVGAQDVFTYTVSDGHGGSAATQLSIAVTSKPQVSIDRPNSTLNGTIKELSQATGSVQLDHVGGVVSAVDLIPAAALQATATQTTASYYDATGNLAPLSPAQISLLTAAFSITPDTSKLNAFDWNYSIPDGNLDFLGAGERIVLASNISIGDQYGGATQTTVTTTLRGSNDLPITQPDSATTAAGATVNIDTAHGLLANDTDPNLHDTLSISTIKFGSHAASVAVGSPTTIKGAYGTLVINADGSYAYTSSVPYTAVTLQDVFTYAVRDSHGGQATSNLIISTQAVGPTQLSYYPIAVAAEIAEGLSPHEILQGNRSDPNDKLNDHGTGTGIDKLPLQWAYDFPATVGTQVYAVAGGVVVAVYDGFKNSDKFKGYGNIVTVKTTSGGETFYATYAHLAGLDGYPTNPISNLYAGETISAGQLIALSGQTGTYYAGSFHAHLHIQFGTSAFNNNLKNGDSTTYTSADPAWAPGAIADGSNDPVAPAYFSTDPLAPPPNIFPGLFIDLNKHGNSSDAVYNGTTGPDFVVANTVGDTIVTFGGADQFVLPTASSGRAVNRIELYDGSSIANGTPGNALYDANHIVPGRVASITDAQDLAQPGFWGVAGSPAEFGSLAPGGATSVDLATVVNFQPGVGGDGLDFSVAAWGAGGKNSFGGDNRGLTAGDLLTHPASAAAGADAVIQNIVPGTLVSAGSDLLFMTQGNFADAGSAAAALLSSAYAVTFADALPVHTDVHLLVGYQDLNGNAHIMDMEFLNASAAPTSSSSMMTGYASDMLQLTGVPLMSISTTNTHFIS